MPRPGGGGGGRFRRAPPRAGRGRPPGGGGGGGGGCSSHAGSSPPLRPTQATAPQPRLRLAVLLAKDLRLTARLRMFKRARASSSSTCAKAARRSWFCRRQAKIDKFLRGLLSWRKSSLYVARWESVNRDKENSTGSSGADRPHHVLSSLFATPRRLGADIGAHSQHCRTPGCMVAEQEGVSAPSTPRRPIQCRSLAGRAGAQSAGRIPASS